MKREGNFKLNGSFVTFKVVIYNSCALYFEHLKYINNK